MTKMIHKIFFLITKLKEEAIFETNSLLFITSYRIRQQEYLLQLDLQDSNQELNKLVLK
jgi:hypothetical protein